MALVMILMAWLMMDPPVGLEEGQPGLTTVHESSEMTEGSMLLVTSWRVVDQTKLDGCYCGK